MSFDKKPSEKITQSSIDGLVVTDAKGRVLRLRKPDVLDLYDMFSAIGEDTKNPACMMMAHKILHVATIDDQVVQSPKSYSEFRATLKRVGEDGILAIDEAMIKLDEEKTAKEAIEQAKK